MAKMRCIFCKRPSDGSKSIEHIIPESIGNTKYVLPPGVVCDHCNNYFSHSVEGPLLSHVSFRNLRAWYQVPTKRGSMPRLHGFVAGTDIAIGLRLGSDGLPDIRPEREQDQSRFNELLSKPEAIFMFQRDFLPPQYEMSRFMAKMALEALALRFSPDASLIERLVDEPHYDRIRDWARRGNGTNEWPYHFRQVFPEETLMRHPASNEWVQAGYSHDLFLTKRRETFFAFSLYGYEFVMNVGGPSIRGYEEWLKDNKNISPLVERVGSKLEQKVERGKVVHYLVGSSDRSVGTEFDLKFKEHWPGGPW